MTLFPHTLFKCNREMWADEKIRNALKANAIAGFVIVTSQKKKKGFMNA